MTEINLGSELDGGTFGLTLPSGWQWLGFIIGVLISVAGIVTFFLVDTDPIPALISIGVLIMGFSSPTKLQKTLRDLRSQMNPAQVNWQKEQGGTELQSFWNSATIRKPTVDDRAWVFPAPEQSNWHLETRYHPDTPEELIAEHPNKIGTPRPATVSNYALATLTAYIYFALQIHFLTISEGEDKIPCLLYTSPSPRDS